MKTRKTQPRLMLIATFMAAFAVSSFTTAQAGISVLDSVTSEYWNNTGTPTTSTGSYTVTAGAKVLVVELGVFSDSPGVDNIDVSWNGKTMTRAIQQRSSSATYCYANTYYLMNPDTGTRTFAFSITGTLRGYGLAAFTLSGVDTNRTPIAIGNQSADATTNSVTINNTLWAGAFAAVGLSCRQNGNWAGVGAIFNSPNGIVSSPNPSWWRNNTVNFGCGGGIVTNLAAGNCTIGADLNGMNPTTSRNEMTAVVFAAQDATPPTVVTTGANSGAGSLRDAVAMAIANNANATITFAPSVTTVTLTTPINMGYNVGNTLTIDGGGTVTIDAGNVCQHFTTSSQGSAALVFQGLTFINGNAGALGLTAGGSKTLTNCVFRNNSGGPAVSLAWGSQGAKTMQVSGCTFDHNGVTSQNGGGLSVLTLGGVITNCSFSNNTAYAGGGIYVGVGTGKVSVINCDVYTNTTGHGGTGITVTWDGATGTGGVLIDRCVVRNNVATGGNGALEEDYYHAGLVTVSNSVITANTGSKKGGCNFGGSGGSRMVNCLVSGNVAADAGNYAGGISADGYSDFTMINTTVSGNIGPQNAGYFYGGGIHLSGRSSVGSNYIYNSTIVSNSNIWIGYTYGTGAGLQTATPSNTYIYSTIIAKNIVGGHDPAYADLYPGAANPLGAMSYCLIGTNGTPGAPAYTATIKTSTLDNVDPLLSPLADNGGPVLPAGAVLMTHALGKSISPAYNTGSNPLGLAYDQRGSPYAREWDAAGKCDIGAYEYYEPGGPKGTGIFFR